MIGLAYNVMLLDQPDLQLLLGIFVFTLLIALFALANIVRFVGVWRRYKDFVAIVLIGFAFITFIDELWSLLTQWLQITHTDMAIIQHLRLLRVLRLIERALSVVLLFIFVVWNLSWRDKNG